MGAPLGLTGTYRQQGLCAVKCLNVRLFVDAWHHGMHRSCHVKAHNITQLFHKRRVFGRPSYARKLVTT